LKVHGGDPMSWKRSASDMVTRTIDCEAKSRKLEHRA